MTTSTPDAVVIGAGHNGLVAANLLVDAGWSVEVHEASGHIGGSVRSAEVTAPGYLSDLFSAFYPLAAASPVLRGLELDRHGLSWTHAPSVLAHVFPDDRAALLARDVDETAASMERFARGDGAAWRELAAEFESIRQPLVQALFSPLPAFRGATGLLRQLGAGGSLRLARMAVQPVRRLGEERFTGAGAPRLLAGSALHADLTPESAGSAVFGWLLSMLGQSYGFPVPVGGAGQLTAALHRRLVDAGGTVFCNSPIEKVLLRSGVAVGVHTAGGRRVLARRAVLADVPAPRLFTDLVGNSALPARFVRDLANFEWDPPVLKLDWALSGPIPWTATEAAGAGTVHLGVDLDGLTDYAADLATGRMPRQPFLLLGQMTTADPTRSPRGTESAWAYTHLPRGTLTAEQIRMHIDLVEQTVQRQAPGFTDLIVARYVQSPVDVDSAVPVDTTAAAAFAGMPFSGTVYGGTAQLHQQLIFRPVPGLGGAATPIDRLFLAGSSAHPGGGVHGGPGANAARAALRRAGTLGRPRRAVAATLMDRLYR